MLKCLYVGLLLTVLPVLFLSGMLLPFHNEVPFPYIPGLNSAHALKVINETIVTFRKPSSPGVPLILTISVNSKQVDFELDTGAGSSLISVERLKSYFPEVKIYKKKSASLKSVSGPLTVVGQADVSVKFFDYQK